MTPSLPQVFLKTQPSIFTHSKESKAGKAVPLPLLWPDICKEGNNMPSKSQKSQVNFILKKKKKKKNPMIKFIQIGKDNQTTNFPRPFGWISKPGPITQLRFGQVPNPNFSQTVWMNFQIESDCPITIWQISNPNFSLIVWINFRAGSDYPIVIWQVSNPNFSPIVWINFQTGSDYPISIWQVSNPNFSRSFGWISKPGLITQLRFDKCQISIFPQPFGWISKPGPITQLRFDKC